METPSPTTTANKSRACGSHAPDVGLLQSTDSKFDELVTAIVVEGEASSSQSFSEFSSNVTSVPEGPFGSHPTPTFHRTHRAAPVNPLKDATDSKLPSFDSFWSSPPPGTLHTAPP